MDVYASLGFTGSNVGLGPAYQNLKNRQIVEVGVSIPILDWGRGKGRVEMAKSQSKLVEGQIQREQNDFEESIRALVQQLQDQRSLVDIYRQADSIANTRYQIALETFSLGTISILDINAAQNEKDTARRNYINQLYYSWIYYYTLRYITLYDFQKQQNIQYDLEN